VSVDNSLVVEKSTLAPYKFSSFYNFLEGLARVVKGATTTFLK
jgi:hypothetical protein